MLFTDEFRYCLSNNDARERPGERFGDACACVRQHDPHGGGSLMVWGGIHLHGRTPLHLVTGVRNRDEIVRRFVLPKLQVMGPGAILQDDNTTPHRARW